jgi:hypothetical protein
MMGRAMLSTLLGFDPDPTTPAAQVMEESRNPWSKIAADANIKVD